MSGLRAVEISGAAGLFWHTLPAPRNTGSRSHFFTMESFLRSKAKVSHRSSSDVAPDVLVACDPFGIIGRRGLFESPSDCEPG